MTSIYDSLKFDCLIPKLYFYLIFFQASFLDDAADLFDDVFPDDKFVPTDVLAALVLIYAHEEVRQSRQRRNIANVSSPLGTFVYLF